MDDETPEPPLVSRRSSEDHGQQDAIDSLEYELRRMAANLLRVVRGAGKPYVLPQQIINVSEAILELSKTLRPIEFVPQLEAALSKGVPDYREIDDFDDHVPEVVRGSLQIAASRLLDQLTQLRAGESEVSDGVRRRQDFLERQRQKREEEWKASRRAARISKPKKATAKRAASRPFKVSPKAVQPKPSAPAAIEKLPGESTSDFMKRCRSAMASERTKT